VIGECFSLLAIAHALNQEPGAVEELCEGLAQRQQFIKASSNHDFMDGTLSAQYEFRHALYRLAIYERLSRTKRASLHKRIGERFQALPGPANQDVGANPAAHCEISHEYERAIQ
jgi:predicted ATPase